MVKKKKICTIFIKNTIGLKILNKFNNYIIIMNINLAKSEIIHFVGIGGIGMSGLALIMTGLGFKVQGSDKSLNKNIERLKKIMLNFF